MECGKTSCSKCLFKVSPNSVRGKKIKSKRKPFQKCTRGCRQYLDTHSKYQQRNHEEKPLSLRDKGQGFVSALWPVGRVSFISGVRVSLTKTNVFLAGASFSVLGSYSGSTDV